MNIFTVLDRSVFWVSLLRNKKSNKDEMDKASVHLEVLVLRHLDISCLLVLCYCCDITMHIWSAGSSFLAEGKKIGRKFKF